MKSREYRNKYNGLIYWLEDSSVMVRRDDVVIESAMTAAEFFIAVGTDRMVLVEE